MRVNNVNSQSFGYKLSPRYAAKLIEENGIDRGIRKINNLRTTGNDNFELRYVPGTNGSKDMYMYSMPKYGVSRVYHRNMNPEQVETSLIKTIMNKKHNIKKLVKDFPHQVETMQECAKKNEKFIVF